MPHTPDRLSDEQIGVLRELVSIRSWVDDTGDTSEREIIDFIEHQFHGHHDCKVWRMEVVPRSLNAPGLDNLIVEKGSGDYLLYFIGHVDTVPPDADGQPSCTLGVHQNGTLTGLGVWDMKAGIAAMIDVMRRIDVPQHMKVVAAFVVDEERESQGMLKAINGDTALPRPNLAFFPEINNPQSTPLRRTELPITIGRSGHLKTVLSVNSFNGGHAGDLENSGDATNELFWLAQEVIRSFEIEQQRRTHRNRILGPLGQMLRRNLVHTPEMVKTGNLESDRQRHLSTSVRAHTDINFLFSSPHTLEGMEQWEKRCIQRIAHQRRLAKRGIRYTIEPAFKRTNYPPFRLDIDSHQVQNVKHAIHLAFQGKKEVRYVRDRSTADSNLTNFYWRTGIDCGPIGGNAHRQGEWTSQESVVHVIHLMEELMSGRFLDQQ